MTASPFPTNSERILRYAGITAGYLAAFILADLLTLRFQVRPGVTIWYPPAGISMALLVAMGPRFAPAVAVASLVSSFVVYEIHVHPAALVLWAAILAGVYAAASAFVRSGDPSGLPLSALPGVTRFVLAGIAAPWILAVLSTTGQVLGGTIAWRDLPDAALQWWIGEAVGVLATAPFLLLYVAPWVVRFGEGAHPAPRAARSFPQPPIRPVTRPRARPSPPGLAETMAQAASVVAALAIVFSGWSAPFPPFYICFPPLIWIAVRHGLRGSTTAVLALDVGSSAAAVVLGHPVQEVAAFEVFLLAVALTGLLMGAVVDSMRRAEQRASRQGEQLRTVEEIGRLLAQTLDLQQIYENLARAVHRLLPGVSTLFISTYDPVREIITAAHGEHEGKKLDVAGLPQIPLEPPGVGTQSEAIRTRRPLIVGDLQARLAQVRTNVRVGTEGPPTQSGLYVPMVAGDRVLGVIQVQSMLAGRFAPSDAELLGMVGNTAAVAIQNARLFAETQRRLERLRSLHAIDLAISGSVDVHVTLGILLDQVLTHLRVDAADVLLLNPLSQVLEHAAGKGFRARGWERVRVRIGEGPAGRAALERKAVRFLRDAAGAMDVARVPLLAEEGVVGYAAAPMVARGHVVGVLEVFGRAPLDPDPEWLEFLEGLASQAAIAVDSAALFSDLHRRNVELMLAQDTALETLASALDLREAGAEGHAQRVADLAVRLAREMGMREEDVVHLRRGALLHDVGKIAIPDAILLKPGPLVAEEWEIVRRHPQAAYDLLAPVAFLRPALDVVYCHHERWDGSGYPRGLKGEEIPLPARIFSVANVYDALTSDRPWRKAWPEGQAGDYVRDHAGSEFDPGVVHVFLGMLRAARS